MFQVSITSIANDVRDRRSGVVVEGKAVVDRTQVAVGILVDDDGGQPLPVRLGLARHQAALVGHRPPHVREGREPPHRVPDQAVVGLGAQIREAPPVVGVEEDDVGLDAQVSQGEHPLLDATEERGFEQAGVPALLAEVQADGRAAIVVRFSRRAARLRDRPGLVRVGRSGLW
jgi:hypothetical protein